MNKYRLGIQQAVAYVFVLYLVMMPFYAFTQPGLGPIRKSLKEEKEKFLRQLKSISQDAEPIARFFDSETNKLYVSISSNRKLQSIEREKALRSIIYFTKELDAHILLDRANIYDIPGAVHSFKNVLDALMRKDPLLPLVTPVPAGRAQLLASTFTQYEEHSLLDDVAVYKRVSSAPEFVLQFLESKPTFRFADSLLLLAAAHDPVKIIYYLNNRKTALHDKIRVTNNFYLRKIASLSGDRNASELVPFVIHLAQNKLTAEEILQKRMNVDEYFQLLVNSLQEIRNSGDSSSIFIKPLRSAIREKSLYFFVNQINDLHSSPDATRFASVNRLRPIDLYYIITSSGEELYTSSYLGLYKKLIENFKGQSADSLFDLVQFDNFHIFMRLAANYNVLTDYLHRMFPARMHALLKLFITGIETNVETGLERAMDIADCFVDLNADTEIGKLINNELLINLDRCKTSQKFLGIRLYNILLEVFELVKQNGIDRIWSKLGNYEILKRSSLVNHQGQVSEVVMFYGDEDGIASFNNFLRTYSDKKKWVITRNHHWVSIKPLSGNPLIIYANIPLDIQQELDLKAQDSLFTYLGRQSQEPSVLVHRGHSYHLEKTLKRLNPSVRLALLGSCGSYNKAISIASINPDVQVIGSKKTGAKSINDHILEQINETLVTKGDINWPEIWNYLENHFGKEEATLHLFNEYFPPYKNLSLFVLKLFKYGGQWGRV